MTNMTMPTTDSIKLRLRPAGYWLVFSVPALMPLAWWLVETTGSFV